MRLRRYVYSQLDSRTSTPGSGRTVLRETGKLGQRQPYFFLQPLNRQGWLFERSGAGWVVAQAQKIAENQTFLRTYDVWDRVTIFERRDGAGAPRVTSERLGLDLVSFTVYEQKLLEQIDLGKAV